MKVNARPFGRWSAFCMITGSIVMVLASFQNDKLDRLECHIGSLILLVSGIILDALKGAFEQ